MKLSAMAAVVASIVAGTVMLGGCGDNQGRPATSRPTSPNVVNQADVTFAQQMIPHHQQAVAMADMAQHNAQSEQVRRLATQIKAEQEPEIRTMFGWLQAWGQPGASANASMSPGMMPSGMPSGMPHMPSVTPMPEMSEMRQMHGQQFDRTFLQAMIAHHEEAVAMAKTEQASGANPDAKRLAKHIETTQTEQIAQMRQMLNTPSPSPS